jgi:diguanylate cyclase (GGDEF)-like protein
MEYFNPKAIKSLLLPGGVILLGAFLLLKATFVPLPPSGVNFFYYAVFIAAGLLAWRFHSTRILFSVLILMLAHHAIVFFAEAHGISREPGRTAFEAVALLIPLDFIFMTFFPERSSEGSTWLWFSVLLFFESVFVAVLSRAPDQPSPSFLHFSILHSYHPRVPQPALLLFIVAVCLLVVRSLELHKAIESGMLWSLVATCLGLFDGAIGKHADVYFATGAFVLASSIVESSYSLAYQDELTGLPSRRAFNDALLRLKRPYTIAVVDIDHFKKFNDTYGHDTGDQVLRLVASRLARVGGGGDAYRVGGEEFAIHFPGKSAAQTMDYLELLRLNVENASFRVRSGDERRKEPRANERRTLSKSKPGLRLVSQPVTLSVTVSIGVAEAQPRQRVEIVIEHADKALYKAKQGGRNRIEAAALPKPVKKSGRAKKSGPV